MPNNSQSDNPANVLEITGDRIQTIYNMIVQGDRTWDYAALCQLFETGHQAIGHGLVDQSTKSLKLFSHYVGLVLR